MNIEEMMEIMQWISKEDSLTSLPLDEQLCVQMAYVKMCEHIKPIYDKHKEFKPLFSTEIKL